MREIMNSVMPVIRGSRGIRVNDLFTFKYISGWIPMSVPVWDGIGN